MNSAVCDKEQPRFGHDEELQKIPAEEEPAVREFDPAFVRRTMRKVSHISNVFSPCDS